MTEERKVLVGRLYNTLSTTWNEWQGSFDEVCESIATRRSDDKVRDVADEIIEVIVVRRAKVSAIVRVDEVEAEGDEE